MIWMPTQILFIQINFQNQLMQIDYLKIFSTQIKTWVSREEYV